MASDNKIYVNEKNIAVVMTQLGIMQEDIKDIKHLLTEHMEDSRKNISRIYQTMEDKYYSKTEIDQLFNHFADRLKWSERVIIGAVTLILTSVGYAIMRLVLG